MDCWELDAITLGRCARVDGSPITVDIIKRNQKLVPILRREVLNTDPLEPGHRPRLPSRLENLNATQSRTFDQILQGKSISAIAEAEGVSRAAIYSRIRGSHGRGGMIRRNLWAFLWWSFMANEEES